MTTEELIVKKSTFLGYVYDISSKDEVKQILANLKKQHKKARHICYAYLIKQNGVETAGFSDDGEPKGTAGKPIYDLINLKGVSNVLVVVVRYFGGILLGAGGLIRAYRDSASITINKFLHEKENND
ncbi:YigZ family protein [Mycoplasmopsis verecunda]|uniref:YigZ family protein n=1 Tax=Mycoplasmopsis verecunda TaxID=171291 RepID=UPI00298D4C1F|nr:YigZ family protein [Mycoplasmopsis verecunda]WPB54370.1 YigZ family protein [Mycoplasmopsis verecunda]